MYPTESGQQLRRDPSKNRASKSLVLKRFLGEGTRWDLSLLVSLASWDTLALCTPPLSQRLQEEIEFVLRRFSKGHQLSKNYYITAP